MISNIFIIIAALMNASMDMLENEVAFNKSVFSNLNRKFWLKSESWNYALRIFGWKLDAWHIAKSLMIIFMVLAMVTYSELTNWFGDMLLYGIAWNASFNVFYNQLLRK